MLASSSSGLFCDTILVIRWIKFVFLIAITLVFDKLAVTVAFGFIFLLTLRFVGQLVAGFGCSTTLLRPTAIDTVVGCVVVALELGSVTRRGFIHTRGLAAAVFDTL